MSVELHRKEHPNSGNPNSGPETLPLHSDETAVALTNACSIQCLLLGGKTIASSSSQHGGALLVDRRGQQNGRQPSMSREREIVGNFAAQRPRESGPMAGTTKHGDRDSIGECSVQLELLTVP